MTDEKPKWVDLFGIATDFPDESDEQAIRRKAIEEYQASDERHLNSCIWIDPGRQSGEPCFGGTRIPVDPVMSVVDEAGAEAAKKFWPNVTEAHIVAGRLWRERYKRKGRP